MGSLVGAGRNEAKTLVSPAQKAAEMVELCNKKTGSQNEDGSQPQSIRSGTVGQEPSEQRSDGRAEAQADHNQVIKTGEGERCKRGFPKLPITGAGQEAQIVKALAKHSQARQQQREPGQDIGKERGHVTHAAQQVKVVYPNPNMMEINAELNFKVESL